MSTDLCHKNKHVIIKNRPLIGMFYINIIIYTFLFFIFVYRSLSEEESPLDEVPLMMSEDGFDSENESLTRGGKKHGPLRACCAKMWNSCCK